MVVLRPKSQPMKKRTPEQVIAKLRRAEALIALGNSVAEAAREIEVSQQSPPPTVVDLWEAPLRSN